MNRVKTIFIIILIVLTGILFAAGETFPLLFINPTVHLWTNISLLLFFVVELVIILLIFKPDQNVRPAQTVNTFMGIKVGKILLSICFIAIYILAIKTEIERFLTIFIILYFIYLILETIFLLKRQKLNKLQIESK
ncbi:MAG: hypothetical protein FWD66_03790 [Paludibacter sp.]|nr:hypothetical protein [Paludibacter sp.]